MWGLSGRVIPSTRSSSGPRPRGGHPPGCDEEGARVDIERLKERLRSELATQLPGVRLSFEPADIINEVMSFGSPTPVDVSVSGPNLAENRAYAEKIAQELAKMPSLRDLQYGLSLDYPTVEHRRRSRARGPERRHRSRGRPFGCRGHLVEPVRRAELLARPQDRHRLSGPG